MKIKTHLLVSIFVFASCTTQSKFIPIDETSDLEWNDRFNSEDWREKFNKCRPFLYMEDNSWHWCMNNT